MQEFVKIFGDLQAVQPLDLEIFAGDILAILGRSGCGNLTLGQKIIIGWTRDHQRVLSDDQVV